LFITDIFTHCEYSVVLRGTFNELGTPAYIPR
jgi:hypothetical protein